MGINYHSQLTITGVFGPSAGFPPRKDSIRTNDSNSKPPNHQMPQTAVKLDESFDSNSLTMKENTSQNHSLDLVFHSIHSHSSIKSLLASNLISWQWSDMICRFVVQTRAISTFRWMQPLEINQMDLLFTTVWMNKRCYGSQRSNLKEKNGTSPSHLLNIPHLPKHLFCMACGRTELQLIAWIWSSWNGHKWTG